MKDKYLYMYGATSLDELKEKTEERYPDTVVVQKTKLKETKPKKSKIRALRDLADKVDAELDFEAAKRNPETSQAESFYAAIRLATVNERIEKRTTKKRRYGGVFDVAKTLHSHLVLAQVNETDISEDQAKREQAAYLRGVAAKTTDRVVDLRTRRNLNIDVGNILSEEGHNLLIQGTHVIKTPFKPDN